MTYAEIATELTRLTDEEKLDLLTLLTRSLETGGSRPSDRSRALASLRGIARPEQPLPPHYDWKEDYIDHLVQKYS